MAEFVDAVVIGAGVIGLACARALAKRNLETLIIEAESTVGIHTSSRNSEVIHSGIYYPQSSLKANLCVEGQHLLYDFCKHFGVAYRRCGKLIVATTHAQKAVLETLYVQAQQNGVADIQMLDTLQTQAMEPALNCTASLFSPSTGIIDSHGFMLALLGNAQSFGATLALRSPVLKGQCSPRHIQLEVGGQAPCTIDTHIVINATGFRATELARHIQGLNLTRIPHCYFARGNYFSLSGRSPFSRLIYPVPEPGGLGVHLTLDLSGQTRFGPDVEWIENIDYNIDPSRSRRFYDEIRKYWPKLPDNSLHAAYCGIRPKLSGPGEPASDFVIDRQNGWVNLFGIESPGLTASLAIAEHVCRLLDL